MKKEKVAGRLSVLMISLVIAISFMPISASAHDGYSLSFDDREKNVQEYYYDVMHYPEDFIEEEEITVEIKGEKKKFKQFFSVFYDADWNSLADYGLGIYRLWEDDYDFGNVDEKIGGKYKFRWILCDVNADGKFTNKDGEVAQTSDELVVRAVTDTYTIIAKSDYIEKVVKKVHYYLYDGANYISIAYADSNIKGTVKIPSKIKMPNGKKYKVAEIMNGAFSGCTGLKKVTLPKTIKEIGSGAFDGTKLKEISIPKSVEAIGDNGVGLYSYRDSKNGLPAVKKVKGFVIYTWSCTPASEYAYDNGIKYITEKNAKKIKPALKAKALKKKKAKLTWTKKKYASGYQIYQANSKKGKFKKVATITKATKTKWTSKTLKKFRKGKKVYYKVRAYTDIGGVKVYGKWSKLKAVKVKK